MSKITLRYNSNKEWRAPGTICNIQLIGFNDLLRYLAVNYKNRDDLKMIEIGSHMGESTGLFAATQVFDEIHAIDPHNGVEEFNDISGWTWEEVQQEFFNNIRHFTDIIHYHRDFSYNIVDGFSDGYFDFIYVDGEHTYEGAKRDITQFLPKLKPGGIMAGHDYVAEWAGVQSAVVETVGIPDQIFLDGSWIKVIN